MFLLNEYELNTCYFRKYTHFNNLMNQASIVSFMRDINPVLDKSYRCVQDIMAANRLSNTDMLSSLFDKKLDSKISHYVNVAIETRRRNGEFVLDACKYNLPNGHRNFYNYKKRIILVFEKFKYIENGTDFFV